MTQQAASQDRPARMRRVAPPDGENEGETVHTPGPGSRGAGSDPGEETGGEPISTPASAGAASGAQEDGERPTSKAMLVITLRPMTIADWQPTG
jgi:hypothetical protein